MKISDILKCLVALVVLCGAAHGANTYFAKHKHLCMLELRIDQKSLWERADKLQQRMWQLEDKYGSVNSMPPDALQEYRDYELERQKIILELEEK